MPTLRVGPREDGRSRCDFHWVKGWRGNRVLGEIQVNCEGDEQRILGVVISSVDHEDPEVRLDVLRRLIAMHADRCGCDATDRLVGA